MGNRVAVVTGGGGGIGTEAALELARHGCTVVVMDPGWSLRGDPTGEESAEATAQKIRTAGGVAVASTASVTDSDAVAGLFAEVVDRFGSLDVVVNAAGTVRGAPLGIATRDDWAAVLGVHLDGYLNVLAAALPIMGNAGYGRVVGFASGVGLGRTFPQDPPYAAGKRAVAAVTWQLGPVAPAGVHVNAVAPIAATRMVAGVLALGGADPGGIDLSAMPQPSMMAPAIALLAGDELGGTRGRILFSAGTELSAIAPPRLIEAIGTDDLSVVGDALATVVPTVLAPAEATQRTGGGSNPRFGRLSAQRSPAPLEVTKTCLLVGPDGAVARALGEAVREWGFDVVVVPDVDGDATAAAAVVRRVAADAVVVLAGDGAPGGGDDWEQVIASHTGTTRIVVQHAAWLHAAIANAHVGGSPARVVHLVQATSPGGCTAAQSVVQMARTAGETAAVRNEVFAVAVESALRAPRLLAALVARLVGAADTSGLAGAELFVRDGLVGLRSHPGPAATVSFDGTRIPDWAPALVREAFGCSPTSCGEASLSGRSAAAH